MVDPTRLSTLLARLSDALDEIDLLAALPDEQLDRRMMSAAKYELVVLTEVAIDVAQHVISSEGYRVPSNFADAFVVLEENAILDKELSSRMQRMAGFRNLLVHGYAEVDDDRVREIMRVDVKDLRSFRATIARAFG